MAKAAPAAKPAPSGLAKSIWMGPLVAGLGFALAYGITERLLSFNVGEMIRFGPRFDVQVFPGTSLENLRLRFGDQTTRIQAELDLLELDKQLKQEQEAAAKAKALKEEQAAAAAATTEPAAAPEQGETTDKPPVAPPVPAPAVAPAP